MKRMMSSSIFSPFDQDVSSFVLHHYVDSFNLLFSIFSLFLSFYKLSQIFCCFILYKNLNEISFSDY